MLLPCPVCCIGKQYRQWLRAKAAYTYDVRKALPVTAANQVYVGFFQLTLSLVVSIKGAAGLLEVS